MGNSFGSYIEPGTQHNYRDEAFPMICTRAVFEVSFSICVPKYVPDPRNVY